MSVAKASKNSTRSALCAAQAWTSATPWVKTTLGTSYLRCELLCGALSLPVGLISGRLLNYLDAVAIGVAHEAQPRAALAYRVGRLLGRDALRREALERRVEVIGRDRDVAVGGPDLVGVHAEVVGQLKARHVAVAALVHEHVDRLVADRQASALLEAEGLVEADRALDIGDAIAG